jgi:Peptidase A4 family
LCYFDNTTKETISMRVKTLGVALVLAALPALAQDSSEAIPVTAHHTHPMQFHKVRTDGTVESTNWSGYAVTGSKFTVAQGSWTVPSVNCSQTPNTYAAFWVGLDGYSSSSVEQTGTLSQCNGTSAEYYAWYEFYPNPSYEITSVPVSPGNQISASVTYNGSEFTTKITNETTGKSYSKTARVRGAARSSAEWIAEAPCCTSSGGILPLADFGTAYFGQDYTDVSGTNEATDSSTSGPVSAFGSNVQEIIMVSSSGADEAVPSSLSSDGTSFDVVWKSE